VVELNDTFVAALVRAGGVLEHLAKYAPDAVTREQARNGLCGQVVAEVERMRVLERVAEAARRIVDPGVRTSDSVEALLKALDELADLERDREV